jgi:hypothetical protein
MDFSGGIYFLRRYKYIQNNGLRKYSCGITSRAELSCGSKNPPASFAVAQMNFLKNEKKARNPGAPRLPAHPFRAVVAGSSDSGKTHWVVDNLILDKQTPFDRYIWIAPEYSLKQDKVVKLKAAFDAVDGVENDSLQGKGENIYPINKVTEMAGGTMASRYTPKVDKDFATPEAPPDATFATIAIMPNDKGMVEAEKMVNEILDANHAKELQTLVIIDDLVLNAKCNLIGALFVGGRHKNASTVELVQQLFAPGTRLHRINCNYFVIFKFGDKREVKQLLISKFPEKKNWGPMLELYNNVTLGPHKWMMLDEVSGNSEDPKIRQLRIRSNSLDNVHIPASE